MAYVDWVEQYGTTSAISDITIASGQQIEISTDVTARKVIIQSGGELRFKTDVSAHLHAYGNVVVEGFLQSRPATHAQVHQITFEGIDEANFVGSLTGVHTHVTDTDVGLWVPSPGRLDIEGANKLAWIRMESSLSAGDTQITLPQTPTGWQIGDEIIITPSGPSNVFNFEMQYDERTITAIAGNTITLSSPLQYAHPAITPSLLPQGWDGASVYGAEIMNMTRNVRVQGTPSGRSHLMIVGNPQPQHVKYMAVKYMGPQVAGQSDENKAVNGRYAFHVHFCGYVTGYPEVKSTYEGLVSKHCGTRAFVPHESHGVTMQWCIAHDTYSAAFWWDAGDDTNDLEWLHNIASKTTVPTYRQGPYRLGSGTNMTVAHCVAVGNQGNSHSAGFMWPESSGSSWIFHHNVAHNNRHNGLFVWQNTKEKHFVDDSVAYHNGSAGIDHGAYRNSYQYRRFILYGNKSAGIRLHASSGAIQRMVWEDMAIDGAGYGVYALDLKHPRLQSSYDTLMNRFTVKGITGEVVRVNSQTSFWQSVQMREWTIDASITEDRYFQVDDDVNTADVLKVRMWNGNTTEFYDVLHPNNPSNLGVYRADWNAKVLSQATDDFLLLVVPGTKIFEDTFSGSDSSAWDSSKWMNPTLALGSAITENNTGKLTFTGGTGANARNIAIHDPLVDASVSQSIFFPSVNSRGQYCVYLRAQYDGNGVITDGYRIRIPNDSAGVVFEKVVGGVITQLADGFGMPNNNVKRWLRYDVQGNNLYVRWWMDGEPEPGTWNGHTTDSQITAPGATAVLWSRSSSSLSAIVDDFTVHDLTVVPEDEEPVVPVIIPSPTSVSFNSQNASTPQGVGLVTSDSDPDNFTVTISEDWLEASPTSGSLPVSVSLTADTTGLADGSYQTNLTISSNSHGAVDVPVMLVVGAIPEYDPGLYYFDSDAQVWEPADNKLFFYNPSTSNWAPATEVKHYNSSNQTWQ